MAFAKPFIQSGIMSAAGGVSKRKFVPYGKIIKLFFVAGRVSAKMN